jgi:hypothetical protein
MKNISLILLFFVFNTLYAQKKKTLNAYAQKLLEDMKLDPEAIKESEKKSNSEEYQSYYFLKNGKLMETRGVITSDFVYNNGSTSILGFVKGIYENKSVIIYWTRDEAFVCTIGLEMGWTSKSYLVCGCGFNGKGISSVSFIGNNKLIISCNDGRVIEKSSDF